MSQFTRKSRMMNGNTVNGLKYRKHRILFPYPDAAECCTNGREPHAKDAGTLICSNITNPGSLKKAAGIRYVVSFCPKRSVSSHRRWRQGWRQCRCAKDSRPLCADLDGRSESGKNGKTKVIQIQKTVKKPKNKNSKKVRETHTSNKKPHLSVRFWWGKVDSNHRSH